jgi:hypothetical protein
MATRFCLARHQCMSLSFSYTEQDRTPQVLWWRVALGMYKPHQRGHGPLTMWSDQRTVYHENGA